jgi:hypothetical protein
VGWFGRPIPFAQPLAAYEPLAHWSFWAILPAAFVLFGWVDRALSTYSTRYWRKRGRRPPPRRTLYFNAGRFVLYAAGAAVASVVLLVERELLGGALCAAGAVLFGWLALVKARQNII